MIALIKHAIAMNITNRQKLPEYAEKYVSQAQFSGEFKTVHLNVGRRTGKTSAMITLARKGDLIIVHDEDTKRRLKYEYPHCLATINSIYDVVLGSKGLYGRVPPRKFDYVWVDEPRCCDRGGYATFNDIYEETRANLYIKLGE